MPGLRLLCTIVRSLERTGGVEGAHDGGDGVRKPDMRRAMPESPFCGAPVEARGGSDAGSMRRHCATEDAYGSETRDAGSTRGHAHCTEDWDDNTRVHVKIEVKNETNGNIPAARPARNPPESTMLARVASRPRPPPKGDAEG